MWGFCDRFSIKGNVAIAISKLSTNQKAHAPEHTRKTRFVYGAIRNINSFMREDEHRDAQLYIANGHLCSLSYGRLVSSTKRANTAGKPSFHACITWKLNQPRVCGSIVVLYIVKGRVDDHTDCMRYHLSASGCDFICHSEAHDFEISEIVKISVRTKRSHCCVSQEGPYPIIGEAWAYLHACSHQNLRALCGCISSEKALVNAIRCKASWNGLFNTWPKKSRL